MSLLQLFQARMAATVPEDVLPPSERAGHFTGITLNPRAHQGQEGLSNCLNI